MNYSYVMGIDSIDELKTDNFDIKQYGNSYGISFTDDQVKLFEAYIYENLKPGFWNEYLGKEKVFIFKFKDNSIKKYILNESNNKEVLKLCEEFANCRFESIDKMLQNNSFYANNYYK